jgi:hypothetical protein
LAGIGLVTAFLDRDRETGAVDRRLFAALLGESPSEDDLVAALSSVLMVNKLVLLLLSRATETDPRTILHKLAARQERTE